MELLIKSRNQNIFEKFKLNRNLQRIPFKIMYNMSMLRHGSQMNGGGGGLNHLPLRFCKSMYYITLLRLSVTISLRKIIEDDFNERDYYGVPFSEQQYTHGSCYISFKCKSFDQSDPHEWPQILDIYLVVAL